jgi:hypothetical protein
MLSKPVGRLFFEQSAVRHKPAAFGNNYRHEAVRFLIAAWPSFQRDTVTVKVDRRYSTLHRFGVKFRLDSCVGQRQAYCNLL